MSAFKATLLVVFLGANLNICFYIPQQYHVKMYHHENMLISEENDTQESFIFSLHANNGEDEIHEISLLYPQNSNPHSRSNRRKRSSGDSNSSPESPLYEEENMYQATFESNDGSNGTKNNQSYEYDYKTFKDEYYHEERPENVTSNTMVDDEYTEEPESTTEMNLNKIRHNKTTNVPMENYCSVVLLFRTRVLDCLLYGVSKNNNDITRRSTLVLVFWFSLYTIVASYLWCTRGWCCCCCPCACCHPHSVIYEAKQFLTQNPPGVAQLHSKRKVFYKPSDYEKDCYKALENEVYNF